MSLRLDPRVGELFAESEISFHIDPRIESCDVDCLVLLNSFFTVFLVFAFWVLSGFLSGNTEFYRGWHLLLPAMWSCVFLSIKGNTFRPVARVAYFLFLLMCLADGRNFTEDTFKAHFSYLLLTVGFALSLILIYSNGERLGVHGLRWSSVLSGFLTVGLFVLPFSYVIYSFELEPGISRDVIYAILATDVGESLEFGITFLSPVWVFVGVAVVIFGILQFRKQEVSFSPGAPLSVVALQLVLVGGVFCTQLKHFRLYRFPASCVLEYRRELSGFQELQQRFQANEIEFEALKRETGETYLVVIGESLNKNHMSLYGYPRDTTPLLLEHSRAGDLLVLNRAYSSHTHTAPTLGMSLTESNQQNGKDYFDSLSILNILKRAGVESTWITNQTLHGKWDNMISIIAHQSDQLISFNRWVGSVMNTSEYDEVVLNACGDLLSSNRETNRVIFVHLMGNHWRYSERYPEAYAVFTEDNYPVTLKAGTGADAEIRQKVNTYDNSVLYNDFVVASLLSLLKKTGGVSGFIYLADHADDVYGGRDHYSSQFSFEMTQIPMLVWLSHEYRQRYPLKYQAVTSHAVELYCNDSLYDTLIGMLNIQTDRVESIHDLFSDDYQLDPDDAYTLHGKVKYTDAFETEEERIKAELKARNIENH